MAGLETDWGGAYRVAAPTTGSLFGGESQLRPLALEFRFGPLTRDRAAMVVAVAIVARESPGANGLSRG